MKRIISISIISCVLLLPATDLMAAARTYSNRPSHREIRRLIRFERAKLLRNETIAERRASIRNRLRTLLRMLQEPNSGGGSATVSSSSSSQRTIRTIAEPSVHPFASELSPEQVIDLPESRRVLIKVGTIQPVQPAGAPEAVIAPSIPFSTSTAIRRLSLTPVVDDSDLLAKIRWANYEVPENLTADEAVTQLKAQGVVAEVNVFTRPDYTMPLFIPNDPLYYSGSGTVSNWHLKIINAEGAWSYTRGSTAVKVAVCDDGVRSAHPDLTANVSLPGWNTVSNNTNSEPFSGATHGTKVASMVSAVTDNNLGLASVGWKVKVVPVRIANDFTFSNYLSEIAECFVWAADRGVKVANASYQDVRTSQITADAATYGEARGMVSVASGGNSNQNMNNQPDFAQLVVVGASTKTDAKASFSNFGRPIDIVAPGDDVYVASYTSGGAYIYVSGDGTSFAAPFVAGAAALLFSLNSNLTPAQVKDLLYSTADDLGATGEDDVYGHGRLNINDAMARACELYRPNPNCPPICRFECSGGFCGPVCED